MFKRLVGFAAIAVVLLAVGMASYAVASVALLGAPILLKEAV